MSISLWKVVVRNFLTWVYNELGIFQKFETSGPTNSWPNRRLKKSAPSPLGLKASWICYYATCIVTIGSGVDDEWGYGGGDSWDGWVSISFDFLWFWWTGSRIWFVTFSMCFRSVVTDFWINNKTTSLKRKDKNEFYSQKHIAL